MGEFLSITFWALLSFMVADYLLGRAGVRDVLRAILAVVFAALFVIVVRAAF